MRKPATSSRFDRPVITRCSSRCGYPHLRRAASRQRRYVRPDRSLECHAGGSGSSYVSGTPAPACGRPFPCSDSLAELTDVTREDDLFGHKPQLAVAVVARLSQERERLDLADAVEGHDDSNGGTDGAGSLQGDVEVRCVLAGDEPFGLEFGDELVVDVESPLGGGDPGAVYSDKACCSSLRPCAASARVALSSARSSALSARASFASARSSAASTRERRSSICPCMSVSPTASPVSMGGTYAPNAAHPPLREEWIEG